jgi:hypothetical protein
MNVKNWDDSSMDYVLMTNLWREPDAPNVMRHLGCRHGKRRHLVHRRDLLSEQNNRARR